MRIFTEEAPAYQRGDLCCPRLVHADPKKPSQHPPAVHWEAEGHVENSKVQRSALCENSHASQTPLTSWRSINNE